MCNLKGARHRVILLVVACCYLGLASASKAGNVTIDFSYNVESIPVGGKGSFTVPTGPSTAIGLNNLTAFNFGLTVTDPIFGNATFTTGLSGLNAFSFNFANSATSLSLNTAPAQPSPSITPQGTRYYPEAFSTSAGLGRTTADIPFSAPTISSTGTVTINSSSLLRAIVQDAVTTNYAKNKTEVLFKFTPNFGLSIDQAAALGGFSGFNWQSNITTPVQWYDGHGNALPVNAPFRDPPQYGYTNPCLGLQCIVVPAICCENRFPYYYPNPIAPGTTVNDGFDTVVLTDRTLTFADGPQDIRLLGRYAFFSTDLVGIPMNGDSAQVLATVSWKDNNSGFPLFQGAVIAQTSLQYPTDPSSGPGGAEILSVNYPDPLGVPLHSANWQMMLLGFACLGFTYRKRLRAAKVRVLTGIQEFIHRYSKRTAAEWNTRFLTFSI